MNRLHNRNPRVKKIRNSSRIRNHMLYATVKNTSRTWRNEVLDIDESGYPVMERSFNYSRTYHLESLRRSRRSNRFHANGRGFTYHRNYYTSGKSSRVGMRRKQEWREEAQASLHAE